jgi:hypothetical protein
MPSVMSGRHRRLHQSRSAASHRHFCGPGPGRGNRYQKVLSFWRRPGRSPKRLPNDSGQALHGPGPGPPPLSNTFPSPLLLVLLRHVVRPVEPTRARASPGQLGLGPGPVGSDIWILDSPDIGYFPEIGTPDRVFPDIGSYGPDTMSRLPISHQISGHQDTMSVIKYPISESISGSISSIPISACSEYRYRVQCRVQY